MGTDSNGRFCFCSIIFVVAFIRRTTITFYRNVVHERHIVIQVSDSCIICTYIRLKTPDILRVCAYFPGKSGNTCGIRSNSRPQLILRLSKVFPCFAPESFQLRHVDRVGVVRTGSDIDNLSGNVLLLITDRNGRFCSLPRGSFVRAGSQRIITDFTGFAITRRAIRAYVGVTAQRHATIDIRSGVRAEGHRVFPIGYRLISDCRSVFQGRIGTAADRRTAIS